jgi:hypothetical protein
VKKRSFLAKCFLSILLLFGACSRPNDDNVRKEFLAENPAFEVVSLYVGEGNADFATYHINYKTPNDNSIYEKIITYQRCDDNEWRQSCKNEK